MRFHRARKFRQLAPGVFLLALLGGCGCGFDCGGDDDDRPVNTALTIGFSDEVLDELKQVVLDVDSITLVGDGTADVVVDTFTIPELGVTDSDSFKINLLDFRGRRQLLVVSDLEVDTGVYSGLTIRLLDGDINLSYVQESDDSLQRLFQPAGGIALTGFTLANSEEAYTVEFGLALALRYRAASDDYLISSEGVRVLDADSAASVSGRVASSLFDTVDPCDGKADPEAGNRIYIYRGHALDGTLADVHTGDSGTAIPGDAIAPVAVAALLENRLVGSWEYSAGFLEPGDYTLVFGCNSANDDPVNYDGIILPLPDNQRYEIRLGTGEQEVCDLSPEAGCSPGG